MLKKRGMMKLQTENLRKDFPNVKILYAGGVMSNKIIQNTLADSFDCVYFASPEYSTDNACGIALLAREKFLK